MKYLEEAVLIDCSGHSLLGIVSIPVIPAKTGVVIVVGGPQYRVGSHRQFVLLARALACEGFAVLRFDYSAMGDSEGPKRTFQNVGTDIGSAIDTLQNIQTTIENIALWGLCDGASAALLYCHVIDDRRIKGLCLLNPWVRSDMSLAKTQVKHYYGQRLMQKEFWLKLLSGKVAFRAAIDLIKQLKFVLQKERTSSKEKLTFQAAMAKSWRTFNGNILLILSGKDYTAKEFLEHANVDEHWKNYSQHTGLTRIDMKDAYHTFSTAHDRSAVEMATCSWLKQLG